MKRKHRVVVEITADKPIAERRARMMVSELIDQGRDQIALHPTWWRYVLRRVIVKDYERVLQAELRKDWKESASLYG